MECVPRNQILEIAPDSMQYIRKKYELDGAGRMKEAVEILREWINKQEHFKKKDFETFYLETTIFGCKGSLERAKARIDKMCTMRTMLPHLFDTNNLGNLKDKLSLVLLPKHTKDHYRVCLMKMHGTYSGNDLRDLYRLAIVMGEYEKVHDYVDGFIVVADLTEVNLMELVATVNVIELKQALNVYLDGFGMRLRAIHIVTDSKLVDTLMSLLKKVLSTKIASRIFINKSMDEINKVIPKDVLPMDYGGSSDTIDNIKKQWLDVLFSERHLKYMREMNDAGTDESRRPQDSFTDQCAGMPGTFKMLHID